MNRSNQTALSKKARCGKMHGMSVVTCLLFISVLLSVIAGSACVVARPRVQAISVRGMIPRIFTRNCPPICSPTPSPTISPIPSSTPSPTSSPAPTPSPAPSPTCDTTPPTIVSIAVSPNVLWPPNKKIVGVVISGSAFDEGSGVCTVRVEIIDEYALLEPRTAQTFMPTPGKVSFSLTVWLEAWREGNDFDGRVYTIKVTVIDGAFNSVTGEAAVIVPHDQSGK